MGYFHKSHFFDPCNNIILIIKVINNLNTTLAKFCHVKKCKGCSFILWEIQQWINHKIHATWDVTRDATIA